ncbi:ribosome hibernation-promoting factor, HPF/YfiA family [Chondromyces apiculatus]|uniref:Ribosome hibernation promoting factor n=1 Tax=Chondromyces apiculatus DSM 436 TaxID=1192034 RepID=A0A017TJ34_9BACT|nr:ribosome-associated translation inhibitor RaiA [Chondromyces apiculatus]EYF08611.1 Ribosomal subunit interface protein [Chondromyces apiculatus DSM 436]
MNIAITFRHMAGSDAVRTYAEEKVAKLQKFLRQAMTAHVTIAVEGLEHIADVRISAGGVSHQANERSADMYASIDAVIDKLERQIRDGKGHSLARKRGGTRAGEYAADILQMSAAPATSARSRS